MTESFLIPALREKEREREGEISTLSQHTHFLHGFTGRLNAQIHTHTHTHINTLTSHTAICNVRGKKYSFLSVQKNLN